MAAAKKRKIQVSEIEAGNRTLEAVLMDLAERSARAEERSARAEEQSMIALQTIASVLQDFRAFAGRAEARFDALEKKAAGT